MCGCKCSLGCMGVHGLGCARQWRVEQEEDAMNTGGIRLCDV